MTANSTIYNDEYRRALGNIERIGVRAARDALITQLRATLTAEFNEGAQAGAEDMVPRDDIADALTLLAREEGIFRALGSAEKADAYAEAIRIVSKHTSATPR